MNLKTEEEEKQYPQQEIPILNLTQLKVLNPLGRGAKGVVFHVRFQSENLALKVISKELIKRKGIRKSENRENNTSCSSSNGGSSINKIGGNVFADQSRIGFEQQVLKRLNHPLFPMLRGVLETEKIIGYAIDYCPGKDLNCLRKQQTEKMFSDDVIRFYGAELVLALEYLHGLGIVYRDLKPENVLIQENGHLMLVDFDLSTKLSAPKSPKTRPNTKEPEKRRSPPKPKRTLFRNFSSFCNSGISPEDSDSPSLPLSNSMKPAESNRSDSDKSNSFVGTEEYVAPEVIIGKGHKFAVDWWSLGVVLHEMLYGTTPFRGSNRKETFYRILSKKPELVGELTPLRDLIRRLLEKDPKQRITLEGIKGHDFFKGVDWEMILKIQRPPFVPIGGGGEMREEDMDGIMEIDVEGIVQGIFKSSREVGNENTNNDDDNNNNNYYSNNYKEEAACQNRDDSENECVKGNCDHCENRGVWLVGLHQSYDSDNFLVF